MHSTSPAPSTPLKAKMNAKFKVVFEAIRELMTPPEPKKRPIGFVTPREK